MALSSKLNFLDKSLYNSITPFLLGNETVSGLFNLLHYFPSPIEKSSQSQFATLTGSRVDILGGGISGILSAYFAAELSNIYRLNLDVHLWEKNNQLGSEATSQSMGRLKTSLFWEPTLSAASWSSLFYENLGTIMQNSPFGHNVPFEMPYDLSIERRGYLWLFESDEKLNLVNENMALLKSKGIPSFILDRHEIGQVSPHLNLDKVSSGYFSPTEGRIEPVSFVNALAHYCKTVLDVKIHLGQQIEAIRINSNRDIVFETNDAKICTPYVSLAMGSFTPWMLRNIILNGRSWPSDAESFDQGLLTVCKKQVSYIKGYSEAELDTMSPLTVWLPKKGSLGGYFSRESRHSSNLIIGSSGNYDLTKHIEDKPMNHASLMEDLHFTGNYFSDVILNQKDMLSLLPRTDELKLIATYGHRYAITRDWSPLVGRIPYLEKIGSNGNLSLLTGDSGHGIMLAPYMALMNILTLFGARIENPFGFGNRHFEKESEFWSS